MLFIQLSFGYLLTPKSERDYVRYWKLNLGHFTIPY